MKMKYPLIFMTMMAVVSFSSITSAGQSSFPFKPGEKLTFRVKWVFIPAGEVVLKVGQPVTIEGVKARHFSMDAKTLPHVDLFYKIRDRIDGYTNDKMTHSILYKKKKVGKRKKDITVTFDWERNIAQYTNFGEKHDAITLLRGAFDPLSVFYAFRLFDLSLGQELKIPVTDGKKCIMGKARAIKKEVIKIGEKKYDTFLVIPDLKHIGGVFEKTKNADFRIWVTADERRIPVKIKSKVIVGSFTAELVSVENID